MNILNKISHQLIALVIFAFTLFTVSATLFVGYQSYYDLESIAQEQVDGAVRLYAAQYESKIAASHTVLSEIDTNHQIRQQLVQLSRFGPLYIEDDVSSPKATDDSELIYYFQSQLQLAKSIIHLLPLFDLSSISIYQTDPYNQFNLGQSIPSIVLDDTYLWIFQYPEKGNIDDYKIFRLPISLLNYDDQLFELTSIYQREPEYFFQIIGAREILDERPDIHFTTLDNPKTYASGQVMSLFKDQLSVTIWAPLHVPLTDPKTWKRNTTNSAIVVGVQNPDSTSLTVAANQLGSDLAISHENRVWASSLSSHIQSTSVNSENLIFRSRPYLTSEVVLDIPSNIGSRFKIIALSSTENLGHRVNQLIYRLSMITLGVVLLTGCALYLLIKFTFQRPLEKLLMGVNAVRKGSLTYEVNITSKNELGLLGQLFNHMTKELRLKTAALEEVKNTLEEKVSNRTEELKNTQQQLILAEKMASLGQLVAGISHEVNTPLGNCITALSFNHDATNRIQAKFDNKSLTGNDFDVFLKDSKESISLLDRNLRKASELIQTFKNVAVNQSVEEIVDFHVLEHTKEVLTTLRPLLKKTKIQIHINIDQQVAVRSYPGAYYHIISNLIMNSLKHGLPTGEGNIYLTIKIVDEIILVDFKDDGLGMSEAVQKRVFDPFYTTKRGEGGTGLGLYMIYNIVTQRLAGNISVSSQPGQGAHFQIKLPLNLELNELDSHHLSL